MGKFISTFSAIALTLFLSVQSSSAWKLDSNGQISSDDLKNLELEIVGSTIGKTYYSDSDRNNSINGVSFDAAMDFCQIRGLYPAQILSQAENDAVVGGIGPYRPFWISATDYGSEGSFKWIGGDGVTYTDWARSRPTPGQNGRHQNCVYIHLHPDGTWVDTQCYQNWRALCEFPNVV